MKILSLIPVLCMLMSCQAQTQKTIEGKSAEVKNKTEIVAPEFINGKLKTIEKSDEEWKSELTDQEYNILRQAGTERAFSGDLWDNKKTGVYTCAACQLPLFKSDTKFKSGSGWPSFYEPYQTEVITEKGDDKYGWNRVEVLCARCGGHLGHVFPDGPKPTGLRYCINSNSLDFSPLAE